MYAGDWSLRPVPKIVTITPYATRTMRNQIRLFVSALFASFALLPVPAFAGQCQTDIAKIDQALNKTKLDADQKQEVMDLREQAVQLCGAGNEQQGLDVTAQAKQILNID